jgi:hypothetical protein
VKVCLCKFVYGFIGRGYSWDIECDCKENKR